MQPFFSLHSCKNNQKVALCKMNTVAFLLYRDKLALRHFAFRAFPILRKILKCSARRNALCRVAHCRVVNVFANNALILFHLLEICFVKFEISFRVSANRANLRSLLTYYNVTAVTALPNFNL